MGKCQKIVFCLLLALFWPSEYASAKPKRVKSAKSAKSNQKEDKTSVSALLNPVNAKDALADLQKHDANGLRPDSKFFEYASYFLAQEMVQNKKWSDALKVLSATGVSSKSISRKIGWDLFWLKLEVLANLKQGATLRNELKTLTSAQLQDRFVKIEREYILGYSDLLAGDRQQAISHFTTVLVRSPGSDADARIFALAKTFAISEDELLNKPMLNLRAENLINIGFADWGFEIYKKLDNVGGAYLERQALALFRARRYVEAAELFEKLFDQGFSDIGNLQLLVRLSQCYTRTDAHAKAIAIHEKIMKEFPDSGPAASAPFSIAHLYFDAKRFDEAIKAFSALLPKLSPKLQQQARMAIFWSYYLDHKWNEAITAGQEALSGARGEPEVRKAILYFLGRSCEQNNDHRAANAYYDQLQSGDGTDYYELLAMQRQKYKNLYPYRLIHPDLARAVPQLGDVESELSAAQLKRYDKLAMAHVLSQLGLDEYAYDELQSLSDLAKADANLAMVLSAVGNSRLSYIVGMSAKNGRMPGCSLECSYQLRFPQAYKKAIEKFSNQWHINPNLAYAIMRQESAFAPSVVSEAFAYGLMQIIPPTGQEIANQIGYADFHPHDLTNPRINTLFGTRYLKDLADQFGGDLVPTIASYNAGPYNNHRWLARGMHQDWDEYVELIPYAETKNYVKRVLVNFWIYERLYP